MICPSIEKRGAGVLVALALVIVLCVGCQGPGDASLPEQPTAKTPVNLSPGDVVKLSFVGASELNQSQKIRADGKISLPLVGEVTAAGKTLVNFQNELIRLYKSQLRNSDVVVTLESGTAQVVVSGAVAKPAKLTFDRPTTVFQAIMEAGGVNEYGNLRKVHLIRIVNGEQLTQVVDLKPALSGKSTSALYVRDGDVIYVPQGVF
jgi:protein involved in polysaccharide export with SLBB domain